MAFLSIPSSWYSVGKAIKRQLLARIADDLDDLNSRVDSLTLGTSSVIVFNDIVLNASSAASLTGLALYKAPAGFSVTNVELQIFEKGVISSGIVSIDIKKSSSLGGTFATILTTPPSVNFATASNYASSTGVLNASQQDVAEGDYLKLDVISLPTIPLGKFRILVYGTV
jgi:hypothetical protein